MKKRHFIKKWTVIEKWFKPQILLFRDKEDNVVSHKEKAMQRPSEYYEKHFELQDGMDKDSGEYPYKR